MGGRVYDPNLGRFLSADLFVQSPYDTQNYNRYSYVGNNPLSFIDPTGYRSQGPSDRHLKDAMREEVTVTGRQWWTNQDLMRQVNHYNFVQSYFSQQDAQAFINSIIGEGITSFTYQENGEAYKVSVDVTKLENGNVDVTLDDLAAFNGGLDQLFGLTGLHLAKQIKQGQLSIIRDNNWKGFDYQRGMRTGLNAVQNASKLLFYTGTAISIIQGVNAYSIGDDFGVVKSTLDVGVGLGALFGGSIGFVGGASYYGTSTLLQYSPTARYLAVEKPLDITLWLHNKLGICTGCY
jgi:hypothetical protein